MRRFTHIPIGPTGGPRLHFEAKRLCWRSKAVEGGRKAVKGGRKVRDEIECAVPRAIPLIIQRGSSDIRGSEVR